MVLLFLLLLPSPSPSPSPPVDCCSHCFHHSTLFVFNVTECCHFPCHCLPPATSWLLLFRLFSSSFKTTVAVITCSQSGKYSTFHVHTLWYKYPTSSYVPTPLFPLTTMVVLEANGKPIPAAPDPQPAPTPSEIPRAPVPINFEKKAWCRHSVWVHRDPSTISHVPHSTHRHHGTPPLSHDPPNANHHHT